MSLGSPSTRSPLVLTLVFSSLLLVDDLFLDSGFVDNHYDEHRVIYLSAELAF